MIVFLIVVATIAVGGYLFMQQPQFGQNPTGERLKRIQQSPHYQEGSFKNEHFTPELAEGTNYWDILKAYMVKVENKEPKQTLPSIKTDLKNLSSAYPVVVWFGHSSYFLHIEGKNILVDPVFSGHASPVSFLGQIMQEAIFIL
ncbi:MAG: hypothetical protein R2822_14610 [Spirosomataceae bacterium]